MDTNQNIPEPIVEEVSQAEQVSEPIQKPEEKPAEAPKAQEESTPAPKKYAPDFSKPGIIIPFFASFLCFLIVVGSLFLPLFENSLDGEAAKKGFSVFSLVKDEVDFVKDFIKSPSKPSFEQIINVLCALIAVGALVVALINVIVNVIHVIKKTNIPCQGIGTVVSMALSILSIYLVSQGGYVSGEGHFAGTKFGIAAFLMMGALLLSAILSEIFFDCYAKPKKNIFTKKIVQLVLVLLSSSAVFAALGTGIGQSALGFNAVLPIKEPLLESLENPGYYLFALLAIYLIVMFVYGSILENVGKRYVGGYGKQAFILKKEGSDLQNVGAPVIISAFVSTLLVFVNNLLITIECNRTGEGFVIPTVLIVSLAVTFVCLVGMIVCNNITKETK